MSVYDEGCAEAPTAGVVVGPDPRPRHPGYRAPQLMALELGVRRRSRRRKREYGAGVGHDHRRRRPVRGPSIGTKPRLDEAMATSITRLAPRGFTFEPRRTDSTAFRRAPVAEPETCTASSSIPRSSTTPEVAPRRPCANFRRRDRPAPRRPGPPANFIDQDRRRESRDRGQRPHGGRQPGSGRAW